MSKQTSDMEIMEAIKALSDHMDERFDQVDEKFEQLESRLEVRMDLGFDKVWQELNFHRTWLERIEINMSTKGQFNSLVRVLRHNSVLSEFDAAHVNYPIL